MNLGQGKVAEAAVAGAAVAAVICAAGGSTRMGGVKKEYRRMHGSGLTVLGAAVSAFASVPEITVIVIAVPADQETGEAAARNALPPELLADGTGPSIHFVPGGKTRRASIFNALNQLSASVTGTAGTLGYVLIHDGARPWVSPGLICRLIDGVKKHGAVIPLLPLTETPKETNMPFGIFSGIPSDQTPVFIKNHLKRAVTGTAQTPQAFVFSEILTAHRKAALREESEGIEYTDDAEVWAEFCGPVTVIPGEPENRKITFPEDLC